MFKWIFGGQDLESRLRAKKKVRISGVDFIIKKVDVLNYLEGAKVLKQTFDTYQVGKAPESDQVNMKKVREHYADVVISGVVSPQISRKEGEGPIYIGDLFNDWDLLNGLYEAVLEFSYGGKKKLKSSASRGLS